MRAELYPSIAGIPRAAWERMLPGEPESWDYYRAVENAPPPAFGLGAIAVLEGDEVVAAAPMFRVAYRIDTPLQGRLRDIGQWVFERAPRLVSLPVLGIGSPMSDNCTLGFHPELTSEQRIQVFAAMLGKLEDVAAQEKSALIAVKSIDALADALHPALARFSYTRVTSVPLVMLDLPYASMDAYFAALPGKTRGYLKRKMRANPRVRMEYRTGIAGLEAQVFALFQGTLKQSKVDYGDFEQLTPDYFPRVLEALGDRAQMVLCWHDDDLIGFQLSLVGDKRIVTKHIGMKYPQARDLNLYFLAWLQMIEFAIAKGIPTVEMGATTYATKLLFGGHLSRRWLYFRFRGDIANRLLRPLAPLFDFERNDPEIKTLGDRSQARGKLLEEPHEPVPDRR